MAESTLPCASGQGSLDRWNLRAVIGLFFPPTTHPRPLNSFRKYQAKMAAVSVGDVIAIGKLGERRFSAAAILDAQARRGEALSRADRSPSQCGPDDNEYRKLVRALAPNPII